MKIPMLVCDMLYGKYHIDNQKYLSNNKKTYCNITYDFSLVKAKEKPSDVFGSNLYCRKCLAGYLWSILKNNKGHKPNSAERKILRKFIKENANYKCAL